MSKIFKLVKTLCCNEYFLLTLLLVAGLTARLYKINNPVADWHSFRQADTASVAREYVNNGINLFVPRYHDLSRVQSGMFNPEGYRFVEFPIYNAIHALAFKYVGRLSFEIWGRLLSVVFSLITGLFLYRIGKLCYDEWFGLVAAGMFLLLPFNIYFSRVILPEPMAVMFGILSLYCFTLYAKAGRISSLAFSAMFMLLGVLVKPYIIFYSSPLILYFLQRFGFKKSITKKETIVYLLIVFVPFLAWRLWMKNFPEGIPFWKWTFNGDGIRFKPAFWFWIFGERIGKLILGSVGLIPLGLGLSSLKKKDYLLSGMVIGALLYISVFATANVRHDYYQTIIIPAVCLLVAKGFHFARKNKAFTARYSETLLSVCVLIGFLISAFQVKEFYKVNHPEIIQAGEAVDKITPKDAVVIANYNGDTAFLYQTKRRGWPVVELPINELVEEGAEYYVSVNFDTATNEFMTKYETVEKTSTYIILDLAKKL